MLLFITTGIEKTSSKYFNLFPAGRHHVLLPVRPGLPGEECRALPGELGRPATPHRPLPGATLTCLAVPMVDLFVEDDY